MSERLKEADCKSASVSLLWFEPILAHLHQAGIAQLVEHQPSKLTVEGSSLSFRFLDESPNSYELGLFFWGKIAQNNLRVVRASTKEEIRL